VRKGLRAVATGLVLLARPLPVSAEEGTVRSEVSARRVGVSDVVEWTLTLEGAAVRLEEEVAVPPLKNLKVVGGPSVSTQISMMNTTMTQTRLYTYALQPLAVGPAEVGAVRVKFAGGERTTPAIPVEVVPGSVQPAAPKARPDPFGGDPFDSFFGQKRPGPEPRLYVEAAPSRTRLKVGEPLIVTYYIYCTGVQPTDVQNASAPQYPGFWAENLENPKTPPPPESMTVQGQTLTRVSIYRKLLFPTKAGPLTIPAITLRIGIARQSFFDQGGAVERSTKPVAITVDPLPEAPGFSGAVGRFKAETSLDRPAVPFGEAATVRFRLEGTGNLKWVDRGPELAVPGAKVYPPQVKTDLRAETSGLLGTKTWEYVVVPETSGTLTVPALSFSYFDPGAERIVRAETAPLSLAVGPGGSGAQSGGGSTGAIAPPVPRGAGGLALRDALDRPKARLPVLSGRAVLLGMAAALLLHAAMLAAGRWPVRSGAGLGGDVPRGRVRGALRDLERAAEPGLAKEKAAALIDQALDEAFPDGAGSVPDRAHALARLREELHLVRYAPQLGDYSETLSDLARKATDLVRRRA
jgi:hypothetical protein